MIVVAALTDYPSSKFQKQSHTNVHEEAELMLHISLSRHNITIAQPEYCGTMNHEV
jgi:hypothetical protein